MSLKIDVIDAPSTPALFVRATCEHKDIGPTFMDGLRKCFAVAEAAGATMARGPFIRYTHWRESDCDMDGGMFTDRLVAGEGDVISEPIGGHKALFALHVGPYEALHDTHGALHAHVDENGLELDSYCYEIYIDDPETTPPESLRTEVYYPLK
ncbi:MAG: GyrI-like domain-containing protein [Armatimonadetes bacterium]|nr:GyrI-like domain-containing protein [Armatimonadota bacterium]